MSLNLSGGAIEAIVNGDPCDRPVLQILSNKKVQSGTSADRYRLLLSDGVHTYSHAMLATQLNHLMETGEMDNNCVIQMDKYLCNTLQGDRRVLILLEVQVLAKGTEVQEKIGNPQPFKAGQSAGGAPQVNGGAHHNPPPQNAAPAPASSNAPVRRPPPQNPYNKGASGISPPPNKQPYKIAGGSGPGTPTSNRIHSIASLTPYQNRWRIRARVTQKSDIRTWSNSRGEGRLFSLNLIDESGEIRATGFTDVVDKFYNMLEVNKVYYFSKATLKTANKQYTSVQNDYEMTFNSDTIIEPCDEPTDLPTMTFDFIKINELESKQPNSMIDVLGVVKSVGDVSTVVGKQSQKEVSKRDLQLVDQSGMVVSLTLWGNNAEKFDANSNPVLACKGCRLSDWGGRSLSLLASSQLIINPDIQEAHLLKGWYEHEGHQKDFTGFRSEGGSGAGGGSTNWKSFGQVKSENIGQGDKPDYFTSKGTVIFLRKENCMYMACPTEACNKKLVDQGNGMYRCEKCNKEFPNYKWRMILSANLADHSDNQWVTCFQESAEALLGIPADELGQMRETNEAGFEQVFQNATFRSYIFKLRAKMETYNDESRLKTVCMSATPIDWVQDGNRLAEEINKMLG